jgi:signal transduction histidine kinase
LLVSPYGHFIAYYDLKAQRWVSRLDSSQIITRFNLADNLIRKLHKTKKGWIWMATAKQGLGIWIPDLVPEVKYLNHDPHNEHSISNNNVFDIAEDEKGNFWVSTYGGGLHYFEVNTNKFQHIPSTNNLIEGLQVDHHQKVWMISNGQLHKYDPDQKTVSSFDLPDQEKTGGVKGKIFKDSRNRLYIAGESYFISFHPDSVKQERAALNVYLTDFQIFNNSYSHLLQKEVIRLTYKQNYFAFEFAAPSYVAGTNVRYAYKLEGFDRDWIDAGERNYVSYPNLAGGTYVFKVRATNTPGIWSDEYASVRIRVIPPFWKQVWFYMLCAVALVGATYLLYRYRINELLKRQAIRNKIAQDLHDNVGSTLSSISVYSQVAKIYQQQHKDDELHSTLEKISSTSSEMISELNDTVWAINPRNDNMEVILQRMESFAKPLLVAQGIQFIMDFDTAIITLHVDMEKRKSLFSIFKEAINNAVKYAECKTVSTQISQQANNIYMRIKDDGKGFAVSKTSEGITLTSSQGGGNGLINMQQRAREMGGTFHIASTLGSGTTVELAFPIT